MHLLGAMLLFAASPARAQTGDEAIVDPLALNRFEPAFAGDRHFGVPSAFTPGHPGLHFAILGDYAHDPLVLRRESDDESLGSIVRNQLFMHLNATLSLWERVSFNINAPIALFQNGDDPRGGGLSFDSPDGAAFGDLRAGARLRLYGDYFDPVQFAVAGYLWFPTGPEDSLISDKSVRGQPQLILGGWVADQLVWSFAVGPEFRPELDFAGTTQGSMLRWGAGLGLLLDDAKRFQVGAEYSGGFVFEQAESETLNGELLAAARYRVVEDVELGLGWGPGLSSGLGTPDFRAVAMVAYTPMQKKQVAAPRDRDADGIADELDACPDDPGPAHSDPEQHGCPPPADRDQDGIVDGLDACPDEPGVDHEDPHKRGCPADRDADGIADEQDACPDQPGPAHEESNKHGCPPDKDEDGIVDEKDACPDIKGVANEDPVQNGCPPDTDRDGFRDDLDACPRERGVDDADPEKRGCPKHVRVTEKEIVILQQVLFDTGTARIKGESAELIDEVAGVLQDHPEILKLRVEGHTDNRGTVAFNNKLSQARADSVMKALVERGIDADRLVAQGYGPSQPIGDNNTEEGRQKNRRVQFTIIEQKQDAAGPADAEP